MSQEEKQMTEAQSLQLITEMIGKAKNNFHEHGASAILWGSVVGICGLMSFAQIQWNFSIGFDIWMLIVIAVIPQIWIGIRERKRITVTTYQRSATNVIWTIYVISIICLVFYLNIVPGASQRLMQGEGTQLLIKNLNTGEITEKRPFILSYSSIFLLIYAFPTLATGMIYNFKPMIWGAAICYVFFFISLYTPFKYDMLLSGLAGICNWLIPGLILRKRYLKGKLTNV